VENNGLGEAIIEQVYSYVEIQWKTNLKPTHPHLSKNVPRREEDVTTPSIYSWRRLVDCKLECNTLWFDF